MARPHPHAFDLRGFEYKRLDGIYVRRESQDFMAVSHGHLYATYWNLEQEKQGKQFVMYWQADKARHAVTPRFDSQLQQDLWPEVQKGMGVPGLAFYRPDHNEWLEYSIYQKGWRSNTSIQYREFTRAEWDDVLYAQAMAGASASSVDTGLPGSRPAGLPGTFPGVVAQPTPSARQVPASPAPASQAFVAASQPPVAAAQGAPAPSSPGIWRSEAGQGTTPTSHSGVPAEAPRPSTRAVPADDNVMIKPEETEDTDGSAVSAEFAAPVVPPPEVQPPTLSKAKLSGFSTPAFNVPTARTPPVQSRLPSTPNLQQVKTEQSKEQALSDIDLLITTGWSWGDAGEAARPQNDGATEPQNDGPKPSKRRRQ